MTEWRAVPDFDGLYEVSDEGQVRNVRNGRIRKPVLLRGYPAVGLSAPPRKMRMLLIHRLVMAAFRGPSALQVNHINGTKTDNRLVNLEYATAAENSAHAVATGLSPQGERHWTAKLTVAAVEEARRLRQTGMSFATIARRFGVATSTIARAVQGKRWATVPGGEPSQRVGKSGYPGVGFDKRVGKFTARLWQNGRNVHIGTFETGAEAHAAVVAYRASLSPQPAPPGESGIMHSLPASERNAYEKVVAGLPSSAPQPAEPERETTRNG